MLNEMNRNKVITHDQIMTVMYMAGVLGDSLPAIAAIMAHVFRSSPSETLTVGELVGMFSQCFDSLDDMMTDEDKEQAVNLLNRIVEL